MYNRVCVVILLCISAPQKRLFELFFLTWCALVFILSSPSNKHQAHCSSHSEENCRFFSPTCMEIVHPIPESNLWSFFPCTCLLLVAFYVSGLYVWSTNCYLFIFLIPAQRSCGHVSGCACSPPPHFLQRPLSFSFYSYLCSPPRPLSFSFHMLRSIIVPPKVILFCHMLRSTQAPPKCFFFLIEQASKALLKKAPTQPIKSLLKIPRRRKAQDGLNRV